MNFQVERVTNASALHECAKIMTSTPLWGETGYDLERCLQILTHADVRVTGALRDGKVIGFAGVLEPGMVFEPMIVVLCVTGGVSGSRCGLSAHGCAGVR